MFDVYSRVLRGIVNQSSAGDHSSKCERHSGQPKKILLIYKFWVTVIKINCPLKKIKNQHLLQVSRVSLPPPERTKRAGDHWVKLVNAQENKRLVVKSQFESAAPIFFLMPSHLEAAQCYGCTNCRFAKGICIVDTAIMSHRASLSAKIVVRAVPW